MNDEEPESIPIKKIVSEDTAHELATSPNMQPYLRLIKAGMQDHDITSHMKRSPPCRWRNGTSGGLHRRSNGRSPISKPSASTWTRNAFPRGLGKGDQASATSPDSILYFSEDTPRRRGDGTDDG